jgi:uncharacterized protein (DUF885 family)
MRNTGRVQDPLVRLLRLPPRHQVAFAAAVAEKLSRLTRDRLREQELDDFVDSTVEALWEFAEGKADDGSELLRSRENLQALSPDPENHRAQDVWFILAALIAACDLALGSDEEETLHTFLLSVTTAIQYHVARRLRHSGAEPEDSVIRAEIQEETQFHRQLLEKLEKLEGEIDRAVLLS